MSEEKCAPNKTDFSFCNFHKRFYIQCLQSELALLREKLKNVKASEEACFHTNIELRGKLEKAIKALEKINKVTMFSSSYKLGVEVNQIADEALLDLREGKEKV